MARGAVTSPDVTELGSVIAGDAAGRSGAEEITLFDSTGLAIQDLGIALAILEAHRSGVIEAPTVEL